MPRAPRILGNDIAYHVVSKCNASDFLFKTDRDLDNFLNHLIECQNMLCFDLHAYCLMQSHIHIMLTTREEVLLDKIMYEILQRFSFQYNRANNRTGHFWKNRYFSKVVSNDTYGLTCLRYLHLNPVKAKIVHNPADWRWSCAKMYLEENFNGILKPLPSYLGLAEDELTRKIFYEKWLKTPLISQKLESRLFEGRMRIGSRRFQYILDKELSPLLESIKTNK